MMKYPRASTPPVLGCLHSNLSLLHTPLVLWLAWPSVHDDCACPELLNPSHQQLVGELSPIVCLQERGRAVLEKDIHQVVCHLNRCLGLERSQGDELAEAVLVVEDIFVSAIWYHLQIHQVSLPALPNGVWDDWLVYNLVRALPPSRLLTGLQGWR